MSRKLIRARVLNRCHRRLLAAGAGRRLDRERRTQPTPVAESHHCRHAAGNAAWYRRKSAPTWEFRSSTASPTIMVGEMDWFQVVSEPALRNDRILIIPLMIIAAIFAGRRWGLGGYLDRQGGLRVPPAAANYRGGPKEYVPNLKLAHVEMRRCEETSPAALYRRDHRPDLQTLEHVPIQ